MIVAAALAGCGGDDDQTLVVGHAGAAAFGHRDAERDARRRLRPRRRAHDAAVADLAQNPEDQPGGAGDEEAIRVPAEFTISPDLKISPQQISVPAFLQIEFICPQQVRPAGRRDVGDRES